MNSKSLIPPVKKLSGVQNPSTVHSQMPHKDPLQPFDLSNYLNPSSKDPQINPQGQMKIPNLSLAESPLQKKKKQVIYEHLTTQSNQDNKIDLQDNPLGFLLNAAKKQQEQESQENKKNLQAEEEFSKKFKRMYQFPASVSQALIHRRAYRNGFNSSRSLSYAENQKTKQKEAIITDTLLCPCCQNFVNTIQVPLCYGTFPKKQASASNQRSALLEKLTGGKHKSENAFLFKGGDALFFCFIKLIITFLLLRFLVLDGFNLYTNYMGKYCINQHELGNKYLCKNWYVNILSTYNNATDQGQPALERLDLISLVITIISILFCFYGRIKLYELYWFVEKGDSTEDDYTILIQNIPPIPFMGNDSLVKDVNQQYRSFIKKLVSNKIKVWLNSFYSYQSEQEIEEKLDHEFYKIFMKNKDQEADLFENIVTQVSLCYDLTELQNLENFREDLVQHFLEEQGDKQAMENSLFDDEVAGQNTKSIGRQYIAYLPHQIQIINQHYVQLCQKISDTIVLKAKTGQMQPSQDGKGLKHHLTQMKISRFVGKAFVSFQYQHYKHYLLQKFAEDKDYFKVNGNTIRLTLSHAQKPNDVYWKNMRVTDEFRKQQVRNSYILVLVGLLMSTSIMYILRSIQTHIVNDNKPSKTTLQSLILYSIPLWTFLVNYFLDWGIFQLTQSQRHKTKTQELSSLIVKNTAAKFINTSVIYALIFIFGEKVNLMKQNGLVNTIFDLVYINATLNIALQFLQPAWIIKNWTNKKYLEKEKVSVFQTKLNKMLEMPTFDFAQAYSYYLQMIYICSFYGYLLPVITPILLVAFSVQYWVDKYNLTRRCSSPIDMGYFLTKLTWISFEMSLVLFVLGHLVWGRYFYKQTKVTNIIYNYTNVALTIGYIVFVNFFPELIEKLIRRYASQSGLSDQSYDDAYAKFQKTYRAQNPATSFLNQKEDQVSVVKTTSEKMMKEVIQQTLKNFGVKKKHKLKSQLFVPAADKSANIQKLKEIYERGQQYTLKYEEETDADFKGYSTVLCCL